MTRQSDNPPSRDDAQSRRLREFFAEHRDSGLLFTQAMSQTRMAMCISDPNQEDCPIVFANRSFCDLTGYEEEEIVGRNCRFLQGSETSERSIDEMRTIIHEENVGVCEVLNYRKDGSKFWNSVHIGPIYDRDGKLQFLFGSQWDVTDVAAARVADQQFATVMRELNHRIMNMFSVISSIITISARSAETKEELADAARERIQALGAAHRASIQTASENRMQDLEEMLNDILKAFGEKGRDYAFSGEAINISPDLMMSLSMVIFELATNSTKYGSFSGHADPVQISWTVDQGAAGDGIDLLRISWRETNSHPEEDANALGSSGSGMKIMQAMATTSGGRIDIKYKPDFVADFSVALTPAAPTFGWTAEGPKKTS